MNMSILVHISPTWCVGAARADITSTSVQGGERCDACHAPSGSVVTSRCSCWWVQALAAELADTVTFVMPQTETRAETMRRVRQFDNRRDVELALHVPVIGDSVAPFMAGPGTDPAAVRAADSLAFLPSDPSAAAEEIQRRRDEFGFSYFVFGADVASALAPVVAELTGR
jgi:hypothetical protein